MPKQLEGLPEMKPEDQQYFGKLLKVGAGGAKLLFEEQVGGRQCRGGAARWQAAQGGGEGWGSTLQAA